MESMDLAALSHEEKLLCTRLLAQLQAWALALDRRELGEKGELALQHAYEKVFDELADRVDEMWKRRPPSGYMPSIS